MLGASAEDEVGKVVFHLKQCGREAAKKGESSEYLGSRLLIWVQSVGAAVAVWKGAVMPEVCVLQYPSFTDYSKQMLWPQAHTPVAPCVGNGRQLSRGCALFAEIGPEP